jgi:hypothetical protein
MVQKIATFLGITGILFSAFFFLDARYASAEDLKRLERDVEYQRVVQRYETATDLYFQYKALRAKYPNDTELKEELKEVKSRRDGLKEKLESYKVGNQ